MFVTDKAQALGKNHNAIGLRAAIKILDKWSASVKQASFILRISPSTIARTKNKENTDWAVNLDVDVMQLSMAITFDPPSAIKIDPPTISFCLPFASVDSFHLQA